jgi:protein-S-isoprenylcysteine O-methyltransferase Ste14
MSSPTPMTEATGGPYALSAAAASRPSQRKADILAALIWAGLASIRLASLLARPSLLQAGLAAFAVALALLYIIRRPARAQGPSYTFWLAAFGTFVPTSLMRPTGPGWPGLGDAVELAGLGLVFAALWTLNRSFGLAPAHRGLVMRGAYAVVRHPLYAGEIVGLAGYCLGYGSLLNVTAWIVVVVVQVARIAAEEKLLTQDREYQAYQQRVRWRLVPGLW